MNKKYVSWGTYISLFKEISSLWYNLHRFNNIYFDLSPLRYNNAIMLYNSNNSELIEGFKPLASEHLPSI